MQLIISHENVPTISIAIKHVMLSFVIPYLSWISVHVLIVSQLFHFALLHFK